GSETASARRCAAWATASAMPRGANREPAPAPDADPGQRLPAALDPDRHLAALRPAQPDHAGPGPAPGRLGAHGGRPGRATAAGAAQRPARTAPERRATGYSQRPALPGGLAARHRPGAQPPRAEHGAAGGAQGLR